jgi:hypothetical protein
LIPLLLHLPALCGFFSPDPMFFTAGLADAGQHAGGYPWIDPSVGFQGQALGKLSADLWLQGQIPWWNAYNGVGLPLAAEPQSAALFLPFVLLLHFQSGGIWIEILLQIIAGISTYALLRKIRLSVTAAVIGALLFELNGTFAWHGAPVYTPTAFLPLLLLGIEQLRERVVLNAKGGWLLIPLSLAWSIYAGFPEVAYINGLLAGVWVLARLDGMNRRQKIAFFGKLGFSVAVGVALAFPLILPFAEFAGRAYLGGHSEVFAHARPPLATLPLSLMPWLYGPIFAFNDPSNSIYVTWGDIGGYFSAVEVFLVLAGALFTYQRLYFFLMVWMVLCLAKTFDISPVSDLFNLIPLIKLTAFYRYATASWEFAGIALVAMAIDGIQSRTCFSRGRIWVIFVLAGAAVAGSLWSARGVIQPLLQLTGYRHYLTIALVWAALSLLGAAILVLLSRRWRFAVHGLALLLAVDALLAFSLPLTSGVNDVTTQRGGITYLQQHTQLQRTYTLGPLFPNYGSYFKIAQINHIYLPVSSDWIDYIKAHLNPQADPVDFVGDIGRTDHSTSAAALVEEKMDAYEEVGVRYVLATANSNPFAKTTAATSNQNGPNSVPPLVLADQQHTTIRWNLPASSEDRVIDHLAVFIGNYAAKSDGEISVRLCDARYNCVDGARALSDSHDNAFFEVGLSKPLTITGSPKDTHTVTATITHLHSNYPVAVWLEPVDAAQQVLVDGKTSNLAPSVTLRFREKAGIDPAELVYDGTDMAIYQLPHPKPYFETGDPACTLKPASRQTLDVTCPMATRLLRREAFYPGWSALIDGKQIALERSHEIFQQLTLPAGKHKVAYTYRPTHWQLILAGFIAGFLALLFGCWRELDKLTALPEPLA